MLNKEPLLFGGKSDTKFVVRSNANYRGVIIYYNDGTIINDYWFNRGENIFINAYKVNLGSASLRWVKGTEINLELNGDIATVIDRTKDSYVEAEYD